MIVSLNALRNTRLFTSIHKDIKNMNALMWLNTINNTNWWSQQLENDNIMKKIQNRDLWISKNTETCYKSVTLNKNIKCSV